MSEAKLQAKILKWLELNNYLAYKVVTANRSGFPDIVACGPDGKFVVIEVKWGTNTASALQQYVLDEVRKRKGVAILAYSLQDVTDVLLK